MNQNRLLLHIKFCALSGSAPSALTHPKPFVQLAMMCGWELSNTANMLPGVPGVGGHLTERERAVIREALVWSGHMDTSGRQEY